MLGGEKGKDTCTGDGGGPLVCEVLPGARHYYQVGIIVGGVDCGLKNIPGIYLDVAKYREWIDDTISQLRLAEPVDYNFIL